MVLEPGTLGATSSGRNQLVRLSQSSGMADARLEIHVRLYKTGEVPHLGGRKFHSSSFKQGIQCDRKVAVHLQNVLKMMSARVHTDLNPFKFIRKHFL
jgi:hypothetical protein